MHESLSETQLELLHNFGGDGPPVHLAHANGFPPGAYRLLAEQLTDSHHVLALPSRPLWPVSRPESAPTWQPMADDLIQGLEALGVGPVTGIGHSLGGVLTLWAAIKRPDLFRAVVLIDPVILPPRWLWALRLIRALNLEDRMPLVQGALRRRRSWPDRQACYEHYRSKRFFAAWRDDALRDYVEFGTMEQADGSVGLAYPPEWEAHIFCTTPLGIWGDVGQLRTPALVIRGENSDTFRLEALIRLSRRLPEAQTATIGGVGHLLPMEKPEETGQVIREFLAQGER